MQVTITINVDDGELQDLGSKMLEKFLHDEMQKTAQTIVSGIESVISKI